MTESLADWLDRATRMLADAGVPSARHDAEELAAHAHAVPRSRLHTVRLPDPAYWPLVERRAAREPLQHIVGRAWFRRVSVEVGPGVFVPRPETELPAGAAIEEAAALVAAGTDPTVVDLCTGSGVVALSVRTEVPQARVYAVELDPLAHGWAERNLADSGVRLALGDAATAFPDLDGAVDVVVGNPPYIPPGHEPVDPEVRDHDPPRALYGGGPDGLATIRDCASAARRLLRPGGLLLLEHADVQGAAVTALLTALGWVGVRDHEDLSGRPRYCAARRPADPPDRPGDPAASARRPDDPAAVRA